MTPEILPSNDSEMRDRILAGIAAAGELQARFQKPLEYFLIGLCDRGDGRSQEMAGEIAKQILAECFTKSPSLLERWRGPDNLEAFLHTAARNRLKTWWASAEKKRMEVNSESPEHANAFEAGVDTDPDELALAVEALRAGVAAAVEKCPEGVVFMRLKGLHGVDQRAISTCWGHHETQTSRRIKEAMETIRNTASVLAAGKGIELSNELLRQTLQHDPEILLGSAASDEAIGDYQFLKQLAGAGGDKQAKREAVEMMCRDPEMLGFFARALNRKSDRDALIVKDPALSGMGARLTDSLRRTLEILQPSEAGGFVNQVMSDTFADLLGHLEADGGTLWLICPGEAALEAVFNPLEPEISGKRQRLASGIVSLVLATGESACVSGLGNHQSHSPAIDMALSKTTRSMIAVPFALGGTVRGVLTAVRLVRDEPFGTRETDMLERHAQILAAHIEQNLAAEMLG